MMEIPFYRLGLHTQFRLPEEDTIYMKTRGHLNAVSERGRLIRLSEHDMVVPITPRKEKSNGRN